MSTELRPSALPKLQECRCYESNPEAGPAAARGTRIDSAIRAIWSNLDALTGDGLFYNETMLKAAAKVALPDAPSEDIEAVLWAIAQLAAHCTEHGTDWCDLITDEERLKAAVPLAGIATGTMDAADFDHGFLFDFKTGEIRDYKAQMAAYALACMEYTRTDCWCATLLFVDKKKAYTHLFTRAGARELVVSIRDAEEKPTCCEYCTWCAKFEKCTAVEKSASMALGTAMQEGDMMSRLLDDHQWASQFLENCKIADEFAKRLKANLTERISAFPSEYFKVSVVSGKKQVSPTELMAYVPAPEIVSCCSMLSLKDAEAIWTQNHPDKPFPAELIKQAGAYSTLRTTKPKE